MEKIKPHLHLDNPHIRDHRAAIEHRATWMYLILEEAAKLGLDPDFARAGIFKCGCYHRSLKPEAGSLKEFCENIFDDTGRKSFEQDVDITEERARVEFHYCPLVAAWQKQTDDPEKIKHLCDIAMEGDRGLFGDPRFEFHLDQTIASGCETCIVRITHKGEK